MSTSTRVLLIALTSGLFFGLIGWGSRAAYQAGDRDYALLRLSWRTRAERSENCRDRTQQELDALPVHMRTPRVCETSALPYRLIVAIDHGPADTTVVLPAGARHDRPLYILRDSALSPGPHHVFVDFARTSAGGQVLRFDGVLEFAAGHVDLITLSDAGNSLVHRSAR